MWGLMILVSVVLLIAGPVDTLSIRPKRLWISAPLIIATYAFFIVAIENPPAFVVNSMDCSSGGCFGGFLIYTIATLVGAFTNAVVLIYKIVTSIFHGEGYGA